MRLVVENNSQLINICDRKKKILLVHRYIRKKYEYAVFLFCSSFAMVAQLVRAPACRFVQLSVRKSD